MRIQITTQTNEQECGVCALTSLHNYFYKHEQIDKEQALHTSHIDDNGMTIFDFEVLGNKLGLECESYELKWSEFLSLKINKYFVLLVSTNFEGSNHFIIAKKNRKNIEIYDSSCSQVKTISYEDLKNIFLNVIILINKKPSKLFDKTFGKTRTLLLFDAKFVFINLLLSIVILGTSIGCASFLNWIIDVAISKSSINNLLTISFIFLLIYFLNDLLTYISYLYSSNQTKNYFMLFTSKILNNIGNKQFDFLNKVDQNWIYKIDECVYNISNFCIVEVNKFISNLIFSCICICIIGMINYWLLIFCALFAIVEAIFFIFSYKKKKEVFLNIVRSENKNTVFYKQLIKSLSNEIWQTKRKNLIYQIKENYGNLYKNFSDVNIFKSNSHLFKSLLKGFLEVAMIATMSFFVISNEDKFSIGSMTFLIATFGLYKTSLTDIFNYFLSKLEFDVYWQVYKDLTTVSNLKNNNKKWLSEDINKISFTIFDKRIDIVSRKTNKDINFTGYQLLSESSSIFVNDKKINISVDSTLERFILVDEQSKINIKNLLLCLERNPKLYSKYIRYFNLDLSKKKQSYLNCIVINLLSLLDENDKIILIDCILDFIQSKDRLIVRQLLNDIRKNNYVFLIGKEANG